MTILLADDDQDDQEFFSDALASVSKNARLLIVEDGMKLMNMLLTERIPDLIFLDLNMPCKNGYECLNEIKAHDALKHLPVVIISTSVQPDAVNNVYKSGASLYIVKPNNFIQLQKLIVNVLALQEKNGLVKTPREKFILQIDADN